MSTADTEERLVSVICEYFLSGQKEKLTINTVCERASISRQAFNKNYKHLKPFINGQRKVDELLLRQDMDAQKVIVQSQKLVRDLEIELQELRTSEFARFAEFENNVFSSFMTSDVLTHRAKQLTVELRKKALHVELLKRELDAKDVELALAHAHHEPPPPSKRAKNSDIHIFKPDLATAIASFSAESDQEAYLALKVKAVNAMQQKLLKLLRQGTIRVVVFQERYLCSFEKFIERNFSKNDESVAVVNLPLSSRMDIREFVQVLKGAVPLELYTSHCDSEATINAQRAFLFQGVPEFEFKALSRESLPTIQDGYDKVTIFRVVQGD
ncbi:hypothetical protein NP856_16890 [Pseudomonas sp. 17391]|uniref:Uncharacterized protein n=1 Tax=Pseudomonas urmiensis TaxID=2745493 RepID=A0ABW8NQM1_9PSED|nr:MULTISPECIES: hypothetical protein [Pseudomonas]AVF54847.1 hypothetical protein AL527_06440 [Pseudomonas fulva]MBH3362849.1 hypothetical protein [Pseudomonas sp. URMO17WK12:I11]MDD2130838.1 hypothetical protein [Pseudomonas sp. 17391]